MTITAWGLSLHITNLMLRCSSSLLPRMYAWTISISIVQEFVRNAEPGPKCTVMHKGLPFNKIPRWRKCCLSGDYALSSKAPEQPPSPNEVTRSHTSKPLLILYSFCLQYFSPPSLCGVYTISVPIGNHQSTHLSTKQRKIVNNCFSDSTYAFLITFNYN